MAKKTAPRKRAPQKPKPVKIVGKKPKPIRFKDSGDPPVIMDDGGSTRIKHIGRTLDTLLSTGKATVNSQLRVAKIRYIDLTGESTKLVISGTVNTLEIQTGTGSSVKVTSDSVHDKTNLELLSGVTVTAKDDPKTAQRSYVGSDAGAISNIIVNGTTNVTTVAGTVYTMLHLKF